MPIPCPHFKIAIVKRSQGQSAVAGAAYQSGERLFSEYDQKTKFYNKKKELVHAEIMLPSHAPPGYADRATLWNAVEAVENQWNSQLARRIVLAFPVEVPKEQYLSMIKEFCQEQFVSNGMIADFAIHDKGDAKRKNLLMGSNPIIAPDSEMLWNAAIVWRILRRYEYTGALVMGRRKKIDVNTTSVRTLPEDKWIIAENAHEAIVTKDEYYQAQKAIRNVTPIQYKVGDDFALKGKICCGNCNRQLRHERQYGEMVFYCGYKRSAGKFSKCYGGYYREYSVNAKVARAIKTVFYALDVVNQGMQEKQSITVRCMDIEDLEKQAEAIRVEQIKLYESYADGVLLRDAYIEKKKALSEKLAALQDSIRTEKEEQECADELDEEIRALTKQANEKTYIGGLTKECVDAFVSMVYLYDDQTMKIEFNCEDVIRRALEKYGA